jgi:hypothetical protein
MSGYKWNDERRQHMRALGFHVCSITVDPKTRKVVEVRYVHGGTAFDLEERGWPETLRVVNDRGERLE